MNRAMRRVSWNLASWHATVQKLLYDKSWTNWGHEVGGSRKSEYDFLFDYNRNYASILYRFQTEENENFRTFLSFGEMPCNIYNNVQWKLFTRTDNTQNS